LCARLRVPAAMRELGRMTAKQHTNVHRAQQLRTDTTLRLLEDCDAFRRPERFSEMLLACQCDAQGRTGLENSPYPQRELLEAARAVASAVQLTDAERAGLNGPAIAAALKTKRVAALAASRAK